MVITAESDLQVVTPKLPRPALRPSAVPCRRLGKKVEMLDMEQAKLPPPMPDSSARAGTPTGRLQVCSAMPVPRPGSSAARWSATPMLRPPQMRMKKEAGMRVVAPDRPAIAAG